MRTVPAYHKPLPKGVQFSKANSKLRKLEKRTGKRVFSLDLLSGYTCPFAKNCLAFARGKDGRIEDGPNTEFRCYAASAEQMYPKTFELRQRNTLVLQQSSPTEMVQILDGCIPYEADIIRIHSAGEFFSLNYMRAWFEVMRRNEDLWFYFYTKAVKWLNLLDIPDNCSITVSQGGTCDNIKHNFKTATVVYDTNTDLPIDSDDYLACYGVSDFGLLIHGTQPAKKRFDF